VSEAHQFATALVAAIALSLLLAAGWSVVDARRSRGERDHRFAVDRLVLALVFVVAFNDAVGGALVAGGRRPADPLHLVYGVAALVTVPASWWIGGRAWGTRGPSRLRRDLAIGVACLLQLAIQVRLVATG
jgi:hypothetical protein